MDSLCHGFHLINFYLSSALNKQKTKGNFTEIRMYIQIHNVQSRAIIGTE